jgi:hypothetical protein
MTAAKSHRAHPCSFRNHTSKRSTVISILWCAPLLDLGTALFCTLFRRGNDLNIRPGLGIRLVLKVALANDRFWPVTGSAVARHRAACASPFAKCQLPSATRVGSGP